MERDARSEYEGIRRGRGLGKRKRRLPLGRPPSEVPPARLLVRSVAARVLVQTSSI